MEQNEALAENELKIVQDGDDDFYIMHNGRTYILKTKNDSEDLTRINQKHLIDRGVFEKHNFQELLFMETQDLFSTETEKTMYIVEINAKTKEEIGDAQSVSAQLGGNFSVISKSELLKGMQAIEREGQSVSDTLVSPLSLKEVQINPINYSQLVTPSFMQTNDKDKPLVDERQETKSGGEKPYVYNVINKNEVGEAPQISPLYRYQPFTPFEQIDNKDKSLVNEKQETEREEETKNYGFYLYIVDGTNLKQLKQEDISERTKDTIYLKEGRVVAGRDGYMLSTYPDLKKIDSSTLEEIKNSNILGKPQETKYGIVLTTILSNIINIDYQVRNELRNFAAKSDTAQVDEELEEEKGLEEKKKNGKAKEITEETSKLVQQKEEEKKREEEKKKRERRDKIKSRKEEVRPSGFFTESTNIIDRYRLKFTDGTDEYYILTECGDFDYQDKETTIEEVEDIAVIDTNTFCYLVPSDVISRTFPDRTIPEHLSREDIDEINKSDSIIKFESDEKRRHHVFTTFESKKCIETIDDKKKEPKEKTTIKPIRFFTDPNVVKLDENGTNGYRLKFTDGTDEYYVFDIRKKDFYFHDKELEAEIFETPRDTTLYLVPSDVISRTFPDGNIPEHLSYEDANKIENSKGNIELRYNHIFGWKKTIRAIKAQKERQKEKEETVQFENEEVQLAKNTLTGEDIEKKKRQEEEQVPTIQQLMQEDLEGKKRKDMFFNMVNNSYLREDAENKKRQEEQRKKEEEARRKQEEEEKKEKLKRLKIVPQGLLKSEFCIELDGKEYILRIKEDGKELRRMNQRDIKGDRMYDETAFPESGLTLATKGEKTIFISEKTKDEKSGFSGRILASGNITNISGEQLVEKIQEIQENIKRMGKDGVGMLKNSESTIGKSRSGSSNLLSAFSDVNKGGEEIDNSSIIPSGGLKKKERKGR